MSDTTTTHPTRGNPWKSVSMVLMGILLGCAGSAAMDSPTTAHAATASANQQWDHICLGPSMSISGINEDVSRAAREGWELVAMSQGIVCFKRPV